MTCKFCFNFYCRGDESCQLVDSVLNQTHVWRDPLPCLMDESLDEELGT